MSRWSAGLDARRLVRRWRCAVGSCSPRAIGATNQDIAKQLSCNPVPVPVGKWRTLFAAMRLDGLIDEPWPGQPGITDDIVDQVIVAKYLRLAGYCSAISQGAST